ncbi:hypothetical protein [Bradyrhizobium sp. OK095]|uniref:hypothetical protein n=1 Tax=Bradyrhizobium sp. OK095 TaxID=1882760 RepID=UPI0008B6BD9D|nr:hypothetical protein [Bradyrhizobium sp. OK095]SEN66802.1 hypothetical protein SAMN05443254_11021 [Bradyrhizobium sp. OK095]
MPVIPFGEYRPDVSDYEAATERDVLNVVPRGDGYGPFPSLSAISAALGADCCGAFTAYKTDGSVVVFAATSTDLYKLDNTTYTWAKVSKAGGPYAAIPTTDNWWFLQFNNLVFAGQVNVVPQVFDISSSTAFADGLGSPPQARYAAVVGKFIVLVGLLSSPNGIQWSGLNDVNSSQSWTSGINFADQQTFGDGGVCRGVAGGDSYGVILQDTATRRMIFLPGDPRTFQIERIAEGLGIYGPYSLIRAGSTVYFYSLKGFQRIDPGGVPVSIGRERVDRTFFADLDASNLQLFVGVADPRSTRVLWFYKSVNGVVGRFDKALCYDPALDKFTPLRMSGRFVFSMAQPGITLEALAVLFPNLDAMTQSLDSFQSAVVPELAAFDGNNALSFFRGPNLEASLVTSEQGTNGDRVSEKRGVRPVTDAPAVFVSASRRENLQQASPYGAESALNAVTGICNMLLDTRYSRFKARIPAASSWSYINGLEPQSFKPTGRR